MSFPLSHKQLVIYIDQHVKQELVNTENPASILMTLAFHMNDIREILDQFQENELETYCQKYEGFHFFITLLEKIMSAMPSEKVSVPTYH